MDSDGSWQYPMSWGGGPWWDPYDRPDDGWDGVPVLWGSMAATTVNDVSPPRLVRVVEGMASQRVAAIDVFDEFGGLGQRQPVRSDTGVLWISLGVRHLAQCAFMKKSLRLAISAHIRPP
jgi:hypothetical protein